MSNPQTDIQYRIGEAAQASGLTDGGYGDVIVAGGGTLMTLNADVVTNVQAANMPSGTFKARLVGAAGDPQDITPTQAKGLLSLTAADIAGLGALATLSTVNLSTQATGVLQAGQAPAFTGGEVTSTAGSFTLTLNDNTVTNAKLSDVPTATIKGRVTAGTGDPEDLSSSQAWGVLGVVPNANLSGTYTNATLKLSASQAVYWANALPSTAARLVNNLVHHREAGAGLTGAIVFTGPLNATGSSLILGMDVSARNQVALNETGSFVVSGQFNTSLPISQQGIYHSGVFRPMVRWAYDPSGKPCLIVGDVGTSWTNPQVIISRAAMSSTLATDAMCAGWTSGRITSLTGYTTDGTTAINTTTDDMTASNSRSFASLAEKLLTARQFSMTGEVTAAGINFDGSGNVALAAVIANDAVTNAKMANVPTATFKGRVTAAVGDPEDLTVSQAQGLLGISGTNTGDQTITLSGDATGSGTGNITVVIANNAVGNADLLDMLTATIKGRVTAGTGDPEDLTGAQVNTLLPVFTSVLKGLVPASGGGTTTFLRADGTFAAPAGGGTGDVVGPASAVDNAITRFDLTTGKLVQSSGVLINDDNTLTLPMLGTAPAAPAEDTLLLYAAEIAVGREMPMVRTPGHLDTPLEQHQARWMKSYLRAASGTTITANGLVSSPTGTATARTPATTNVMTTKRRVGHVSAATAGASTGVRSGVLQYWRGNAAGAGGFYFACEFGTSDAAAVADARFFVGLTNSTAVIGNVNPSTLLNIIGVGCDNAQTTLRIFTNDGTGVATATDLGANFPSNTLSADWYRLELFCEPNGSSIFYAVTRIGTAFVATGTITTDLPANNVFLAPQVWRNNGATALAVGIDFSQLFIEAEN